MKSSQENILGLSTNPELVKDQSLIQFLAEPPNQEREVGDDSLTGWMFLIFVTVWGSSLSYFCFSRIAFLY